MNSVDRSLREGTRECSSWGTTSFDLRFHRPQIARDQIDELRQRLFGGGRSWPTLPGYEIEDELGHGAFARVYRAFDTRFRRHVAIKLVDVASPRALLRLEREAQALARLSHPNVVQVYDKGILDEGQRYFIALELIDGPSLDQWLERSKPSLREILETFLQIAEALDAAHRAGLVHRDLKPENAVIGPDGRVRLLDFGLARAMSETADSVENASATWPPRGASSCPPAHDDDPTSWASCREPSQGRSGRASPDPSAGRPRIEDPDRGDRCARNEPSHLELKLTADGRFVGTPCYAAPEQHQGIADARSDQFSFCVSLFQAVYERLPFPIRKGGSAYAKLINTRVDYSTAPRPVPRWLKRALRQGLSIDPRRRHESMGQLVQLLRFRLRVQPSLVRGAWASLAAAAATAVLVTVIHQEPIDEAAAARDQRASDCEARPGGLATPWGERARGGFDALPVLQQRLDEYVARWHRAEREACVQPKPEVDACLDRDRDALVLHLEDLSRAPTQATSVLPTASLAERLLVVDALHDPLRCLESPGEEQHEQTQIRARLRQALREQTDGDHDSALRAALAALEPSERLEHGPLLAASRMLVLGLRARRREPLDYAMLLAILTHAATHDQPTVAASVGALFLTRAASGTIPRRELEQFMSGLEALRTDAIQGHKVDAWLSYAKGHAHVELDQPLLALAEYHRAERIFGELGRPPYHVDVALTRFDRALAMVMLPERVADAPALGREALADLEAALGSEHPLIAHKTRELGEVCVHARQSDLAETLYLQADAAFEVLELPLDRAITRAELGYLHFALARRARLQAIEQADREGIERYEADAWSRFEDHRAQAFEQLALVESLMRALRPAKGEPLDHPRARARIWVVAQRIYGFSSSCWDELLHASRRLEDPCAQLSGDEPSCRAGRQYLQGLLESGARVNAREGKCPVGTN